MDHGVGPAGRAGQGSRRGMEQPQPQPQQRGEEAEHQQHQLLAWEAAGTVGGSSSIDAGAAGAARCLCPCAVTAAPPAPFVLPRHALEQEVLRRADLPQQQQQQGDRRRERRMKNRESAARSRLRRHAYVGELERKVELLRAENGELRRLCEELEKAAEVPVPAPVKRAPHQHRRPLQRTSSAPL